MKAELGTGRGLLGFYFVGAADAHTDLRLRSEFRQDWPYLGLPSLEARSQLSTGAFLSQTASTYTYGCTNPASGAACTPEGRKRYFPVASQSVETAKDLNAAVLPTVTTTTQYDANGNTTSVVVSTNDLASGLHSKTTTSTYDTMSWPFRLLRSTVQSSAP